MGVMLELLDIAFSSYSTCTCSLETKESKLNKKMCLRLEKKGFGHIMFYSVQETVAMGNVVCTALYQGSYYCCNRTKYFGEKESCTVFRSGLKTKKILK